MTSFLDSDAIAAASLGGAWTSLATVATTGSTNADLAAAARAGAAGGAVLLSAHQSAGKGRLDRVWEAPPDTCLAVSVLVTPQRPLAAWGWLSVLAGMAVADTLRTVAGLDAGLKWPNDALVGGRKICGILSEVVNTHPRPSAVVGMGLNVALTEQDLPVPTATSVRLAGSDATATELAIGLLAALEHWYGVWDAGAPLADAYRARCVTLGRDVVVHAGPGSLTGRAVDVDDAGCLVVRAPSGETRAFAAGDVVHVR